MFDLFGVPLHALDFEALHSFLEDAPSEGLVWEAKGTELRKDAIRKEACAFANSDHGGYLILGAAETKRPAAGEKRWTLDGFEFPGVDGPTTWVTQVIEDTLRPAPRTDVQVFDVGHGRHVVVVEIEPLADPPCMFDGTVFIRMPGKSQVITDPARLAELNGRGRRAHDAARNAADGGATRLLNLIAEAHHTNGTGIEGVLDIAVAVRSLAITRDVGSRLFTRQFEAQMLEDITRLGSAGGLSVPSHTTRTQSVVMAINPSQLTDVTWIAEASWDGTATVGCADPHAGSGESAEDIVRRITRAWRTADRWAQSLGGSSEKYVSIYLRGAQFEATQSIVAVRRGPVQGPPSPEETSHLEREVRRCCGEQAYEPDLK